MTYFLTFDLVGDDGAGYRKVYEWAHMIGGFHYFKFDHGRWGRLPSTTVLVPCATLDESVVRDEFDRELHGLGLTPSHVMVTQGEAWALQQSGDVGHAVDLLQRAREIAERPEFSDVDRAEVLCRRGACRWSLSSISTAIALFDEALELAERSDLPCDLLRADILGWRSRCHRR